jgi:hypothetical protein
MNRMNALIPAGGIAVVLLGAAPAAADVTVPNGPNCAAQVITVSGKTACDVWPDHVDCIVAFDNPQPPSKSGPANAVTMTLVRTHHLHALMLVVPAGIQPATFRV